MRVPWDFPMRVADVLRDAGVEVTADADGVRRPPAGQARMGARGHARRAAAAAQAALLEAAALLRDELDGLTCERVREHMTTALLANGAESEEILIHAGAGCSRRPRPRLRADRADLPVQIDCFPRHRASGLYIDMSRTWVPGTPSDAGQRHWQDIMDAYEVALADARPGVEDLYGAGLRRARGARATRRSAGPARGSRSPTSGFRFSLGHGVGLEVHEAPSLGRRPDPLAEGDTVAIEPSLGYEGIGFVMVEETVEVTPDGGRYLVEPLPFELRVPGA